MHRDPGIDQVWIGRSADVRAGDLRDRQAGEAEADDEGAAAFDEIAARECCVDAELCHRGSPAIVREASRIAFMTRG